MRVCVCKKIVLGCVCVCFAGLDEPITLDAGSERIKFAVAWARRTDHALASVSLLKNGKIALTF